MEDKGVNKKNLETRKYIFKKVESSYVILFECPYGMIARERIRGLCCL